ncbi:MAG TPA: hypothetical protein VI138_04160 [Candidatus Dormibacteraeota bacterium]
MSGQECPRAERKAPSRARMRPGVSLGQGMVEYSLILGLVALVVLVVFVLVGHHVSDIYSNINTGLAATG